MHFVGGFERCRNGVYGIFVYEYLDVLAHATLLVDHSEFDSRKLFVQMIEQLVDASTIGVNF